MVRRLTLALCGRYRDECQDTATHRSGPLERVVSPGPRLLGQACSQPVRED